MEQLRSSVNASLFRLGITTDAHFDEGTWRVQAYRSLKNLNNVLYLQNDLNAIAALGDNVDSEHKDKSTNLRNLERYCARFSQGVTNDKFIIRGNHDAGALVWDTDNSGGKVFEKDLLTGPEQLSIFKKYLKQDGKIYGLEGQYHYKDFHDKKIRLVFIDTLDIPSVTNSNGTLKYVDQWNYGIQEKQLKWIAHEALGTLPNDYHVMILSHVPLMPDTVTTDPITNGNILKQLLNAFITRSNGTFTSTVVDFNASVTVDYQKRQKSNFIGLFGGHRHSEYFYDMGGYYSTVLDCAFARDNTKIGTVQEDAFCVVEVNTENRQVKILGFGRSTDRSYTY